MYSSADAHADTAYWDLAELHSLIVAGRAGLAHSALATRSAAAAVPLADAADGDAPPASAQAGSWPMLPNRLLPVVRQVADPPGSRKSAGDHGSAVLMALIVSSKRLRVPSERALSEPSRCRRKWALTSP